MASFWNPFANMAAVAGNKFVIDRGEGCYVYDTEGKRYLDGTASLWYANIGYGRTEIAEAVAAQISRLNTYHTFGDYTTGPTEELATRVASIAPVSDSKIFFTSGGSDSVDTAAKLARRYFTAIGKPERTIFITRDWAYHGMHGYGTSFAGLPPNLEGHGPMVETVFRIPYDSTDALIEAIETVGAEHVAGFYAEPVIGAGGVRPAPTGYLKKTQEIVADAGALYIADEVITGFGRTGNWFASSRFSLQPDLITFAKGITSGYLPLGGVIAAPRIAAPFWEGSGEMWRHGYTYSGHTTACVAGLANLDIIEREGLLTRTLEIETELMEALAPLIAHPLVDSIRGGVGALAAVQLDPVALSEDENLAFKVADAARQAGVLTRAIAGGSLQCSPPFIITNDQLKDLAAGLFAGFESII